MLHEENHSLVIRTNAGEIFSFDGRGISHLMQLLHQSPTILDRAELADKVVGKAAAALMILGGIKAVFADTISDPALQLFASTAPDVNVTYNNKVEHIINRTQTGWCPMELACKDAKTPKECLGSIKAKLEELKAIK